MQTLYFLRETQKLQMILIGSIKTRARTSLNWPIQFSMFLADMKQQQERQQSNVINFLHKLPFTFFILMNYYLKLPDLVVLSSFCSVFREILPLFSLYSFWIKIDLARKHRCVYFEYQKKPRHLFAYFLGILIRLYINIFLKINLRELNISSLQMPLTETVFFVLLMI